MKKKVMPLILVFFVVILILSTVLIILSKEMLNKNEKEILAVLKDLNISLQNPTETEENFISYKPKEPISLKEYIQTIYEVRKFYADNGNLVFLFKVLLGNEKESILVVSKGEIVGMTTDDSTIESIKVDNPDDDFSTALSNSLYTSFYTRYE